MRRDELHGAGPGESVLQVVQPPCHERVLGRTHGVFRTRRGTHGFVVQNEAQDMAVEILKRVSDEAPPVILYETQEGL